MVKTLDSADCCPNLEIIQGYAECILDDEQAEWFEVHLSVCGSCSDTLARVVDCGAVPAWLQSLVKSTTVVENSVSGHLSSASALSAVATIACEDRYQRIRLQGEGGMGRVWQGWDVVMKRRVALKQLRSDFRNPEREQRLLQEATSLARLSHPNIVAVHEVLMLSDQPTVVMEYIDGPTLAAINSHDFVMSERQAAKILERLADAMAHAHDQGVIHRDLKPGNVLLSWASDGPHAGPSLDRHAIDTAVPKLTDFGLAKILEADELTRTGDLLGTPAYMAPEQTIGLGSSAGPGTDIYGLGAILYDLLTGSPPHVAENPISTMLLVREREPTAPRLLRPELSKDIETICLRCLQKSPNDRYRTARGLQDDLMAYLEGRSISARPLSHLQTAVRWSRRHPSIVASVVLAASLALTLLLGSLWTATNERRLRLEANQAKTQAELSEQKFIAEAERAKQALEIDREHFEVALDRVNRLASLAYNPRNKQVSTLDFGREIQQATSDIYATYLNTLPPPAEWTLDQAHAVTLYIKYMTGLGSADKATPWLERVKRVVPRFEDADSDNPKLQEFLAEHYYNAHIDAYRSNDFNAAGRYGEQAGKFVGVDARQAAFVLMNSALSYNQGGSHEDAIRAANRSLEAYRMAMSASDSKPDDAANFLDSLRWHRHVAKEAGNKLEADKFVVEFDERSREFDKDSPYFARVQETIRAFRSGALEGQ